MNLETLVIKYTLGAAFFGVTLIFIGKVAALLIAVAGMKVAALKVWILSGDWAAQGLEVLKTLIFGGAG